MHRPPPYQIYAKAYHLLLSQQALWHYSDASQMLIIPTRFSFFKNCIQFSIHAMHYYLPEFSVSF